MKSVIILGSTGSIGVQALDVIDRNRDKFHVVGLAAGHDARALVMLASKFGVTDIALAHPEQLWPLLDGRFRMRTGPSAASDLVREVDADVVLNGITGSVGLLPTLAALEAGRTLALQIKKV